MSQQTIERRRTRSRFPVRNAKRFESQAGTVSQKVDASDLKEVFRGIRLQSLETTKEANLPRQVRNEIEWIVKSIERSTKSVVHELIDGIQQDVETLWLNGIANFRSSFATHRERACDAMDLLLSNSAVDASRHAISQVVLQHVSASDHDNSLAARARTVEATSSVEKALDLVYSETDSLMRRGQLSTLDDILSKIDPSQFSTDLLLGFLTATLPVKSKLPSRVSLLEETRSVLIIREEYEEGILSGL